MGFALIAVVAIILIVEVNAYLDGRPVRIPPAFCTFCGCAIVPEWWGIYDTKFDANTGEGTQEEEKYYVCSKTHIHYRKRAGETRVVKVEAKCA